MVFSFRDLNRTIVVFSGVVLRVASFRLWLAWTRLLKTTRVRWIWIDEGMGARLGVKEVARRNVGSVGTSCFEAMMCYIEITRLCLVSLILIKHKLSSSHHSSFSHGASRDKQVQVVHKNLAKYY